MTDFLILGDYPAPNDHKRAFRDAHGRYLLHLLYINGVNIRQVAFDFLYQSGYDVYSGHNEFARVMNKHKPKVILALGQQTLRDLGIEGSLMKMRGSVIEKRLGNHKYYVVPTYSPRDMKLPERMFADEPVERGFVSAGDVRRAWSIVKHGWKMPEEHFNLEPTLQDVKDFCASATKSGALLGLDIESTGLNTDFVPIVTLGFATDEEVCLVVPFLCESGKKYWTMDEELVVMELLQQLMTTNRVMFQNGTGYDVPLLIKRGWKFPIENFTDDTMVLHHVLAPELPHNIGFISSQYGKQPYWKESFLSRKEHIFETDQIEMRRYNARDCVALHQIRNGMIQHINDMIEREPDIYGKLHEVYKLNMEASWASIEMSLAGVAISPSKLRMWQGYIKKELTKIENELNVLYPLPESFNWSSPYHRRLLIYGEVPPPLKNDKWKEEFDLYDQDAKNYQYACVECDRKVTQKFYSKEDVPRDINKKCPACKVVRNCVRTEKKPTSVKGKSKESKKYLELLAIKELADIKPMPRLKRYVPLRTDKGQSALDNAAMTRYIQHIYSRLDDITNMKTQPERCIKERAELELTVSILHEVKKLSKYKKLVESFWDFPLGADGRVHPQLLVTGTATGRWSCKKPNL